MTNGNNSASNIHNGNGKMVQQGSLPPPMGMQQMTPQQLAQMAQQMTPMQMQQFQLQQQQQQQQQMMMAAAAARGGAPSREDLPFGTSLH